MLSFLKDLGLKLHKSSLGKLGRLKWFISVTGEREKFFPENSCCNGHVLNASAWIKTNKQNRKTGSKHLNMIRGTCWEMLASRIVSEKLNVSEEK